MAASSSSSTVQENNQSTEDWKKSLPIECDLDGYFTSGLSWSRKKIVRYQFKFSTINDTSAPYLHIKRLLLVAASSPIQAANLSDSDVSPIKYTAVCPRRLKKSVRQDENVAQDMSQGKYRPQLLCDPASPRSKWVTVSPQSDDPILLDLFPVAPATEFPPLVAWKMVHGIRTSRRPQLYDLIAFFDDGTHVILNTYTSTLEVGELPSPTASYGVTDKFTTLLATGDVPQIKKALNSSLDSHFGFNNPNSPTITQLLLATNNPQLVTLAFNRNDPTERRSIGNLWPLVLSSQNTDVIRLALNHGLPVALETFTTVIEKGLIELLDLFIRAETDIFYDHENEMITSATSGGYDMLFQVLNKLKEPRKRSLPSLPPHPVLEDPSHLILLNSYKCPNKRLFEEFLTIASHQTLRRFFYALAERNPPEFPLNYLSESIQRGMPLSPPSGTDRSLLTIALAAHQYDVAELLLANGAAFATSLGEAVTSAFAARDLKALRLLREAGAPLPLLHLFSKLVKDTEASVDQVHESLNSLIELGLAVSSVGLDHRSLISKAVIGNNFVLVDALLQKGAQQPADESLFSQAKKSGSSPTGLSLMLKYRHPEADRQLVSEVFFTDILPHLALNEIQGFLEAGADLNHTVPVPDAEPPTTLPLLAHFILSRPTFSLPIWELLLSKGAQPQSTLVWAVSHLLSKEGITLEAFQTVIKAIPSGDDDRLVLISLLYPYKSKATGRWELIQELSGRLTDFTGVFSVPAWLPAGKQGRTVSFLQLAALQKQDNLELFKKYYAHGARFASDVSQAVVHRSLTKLLAKNPQISTEDLSSLIDAHSCENIPQITLIPVLLKALTHRQELLNDILVSILDREDLDPNVPIGDPPVYLVNSLLKAPGVPPSAIVTLVRNGADLSLAEANGSLLCEILHSRCQSSSLSDQDQAVALMSALIDGGCNLYAKDHRGVPFPLALSYESGQHSHKKLFKRIWLKLLEKGVDINYQLDAATLADMTLTSSSFTHFVGATPKDFNYRANENLQKFFTKRGGIRNYS